MSSNPCSSWDSRSTICSGKTSGTVLFGQHTFVLTGRVAVGEVRNQWSPVKLAEVLRPFVPELADQLNDAGRGLATVVRQSAALPQEARRLHEALMEFAARVTGDEGSADDVRRSPVA